MSQRLVSEPQRFDFFQALRLLQQLAHARAASEPGYRRVPIGRDGPPRREVVRCAALSAHTFPTGAIDAIEPAADGQLDDADSPPPKMVVGFLGMTGPSGVLPQHYTQLIIDRLRHRDTALRDFFDLFNHRVLSFFFRAWEKYRFPFAYERSMLDSQRQGDDLFTQGLYCLVGMGTGHLRGRLDVPDALLLYYAGHFARFPRAATSLERILADHLQLPVAVRQFQGQWLHLPTADQTRLPTAAAPNGHNSRLGVDTVVGARVWNVESKFRLRIGPLGYRQFLRLTPAGGALTQICQLTRTYVGPELDFDVQLVLRADEVPWSQLGGSAAQPSRLGWNAWIRSGPCKGDVDDAIFVHEGWPAVSDAGHEHSPRGIFHGPSQSQGAGCQAR